MNRARVFVFVYSTMKLFIVRHGESEGNLYQRHQTETEELTTSGELQAKKVAQRFSSIKINQIISSPMTRAKQTAEAISIITHAPIIFDDRFKEIKNPTQLHGLSHTEPAAKKIKNVLGKHLLDSSFHYSDEENYFDFIKRVATGLHALEAYENVENIVLTTHGHTLRVLFGLIVFGTEFSPREFDLMIQKLVTNNTGVTMAEFSLERGWRLIAYNDHAHLLD